MTAMLATALCLVFVQGVLYAQESKADMTTYITLTVKQGVKIRMKFAAPMADVWVKVTGVKNDKEEQAPTSLQNNYQEYETTGTQVKVYGTIDKFDCYGNKENLKDLDVSKNAQLTTLNCGDNLLISLDVSKNTQLTYLNCGSNPINTLDVSHNTLLTELYCSSTSYQLRKLDLSRIRY